MRLFLHVADIFWSFESERPLQLDSEIEHFLSNNGGQEEVKTFVSWKWDCMDQLITEPIGEDLIQSYYYENKHWYCMTDGGKNGFVGGTIYTDEMDVFHMYLNEKPFLVCAPWARSNGCKSRTCPDSGKCIAEQQGCPS